MHPLNIGDAAAAAGVTPKMIRHYEALGLIPEADRTDAGYRLYGERELAMLRFIRQSRGLGFSMKQIEALLDLWRDPHRASREVREVARAQLAELEERQREIDRMRATLRELVADCRGDEAAHCAILDRLALPPVVSPQQPARRGLKEVKPGTRRAAARPARQPAAAPAPAHAGLAAWMHAVGRG